MSLASFQSQLRRYTLVLLGGASTLVFTPSWAQQTLNLDQGEVPPMLELPHKALPPPSISADMPWPWWYWLLGASLVLALLYLLAFFIRNLANHEAEPPLPAILEARKALLQLKTQAESLPVQTLSHELSLILRRYQSRKFLQPFQCKTMEEIYELESFARFNLVKDLFKPVAQELDTISFSPNANLPERKQALIDSVSSTLETVDKTPIPNPSSPALS